MVIHKPAGAAAHPSPGVEGTHGGSAHWPERGSPWPPPALPQRQGIVYRPGRGDVRSLVVARDESAYSQLKRAFKERTVTKVYHAVVQGIPDLLKGTIDAPIGRHPATSGASPCWRTGGTR
ncbi:pseudouridine synthase [Kocuria rhizophila]|nr:pseudouridine synthase [Kocuria rhizophila]